jgi:hypothetical protein
MANLFADKKAEERQGKGCRSYYQYRNYNRDFQQRQAYADSEGVDAGGN